MLSYAVTIGPVIGALAALGVAIRAWLMQSRVQSRLWEQSEASAPLPTTSPVARQNWLARWLALAGFRSPLAMPCFLLATLAGIMVGGIVVLLCYVFGIVDLMVQLLSFVPGGVGEVFLPFAYGSPWMVLVLLATLPALYVRAARRKRVTAVEQDLPLTLDLLATLSEAGLGFDAALDRILATQPPDRPLVTEFRAFQVDILAGRSRVEALRRLAKRLEVTWFSIFVAALVQAEQIGSGVAEVLRVQADDLRERRRERALALAMSVPVKLLFPLIICFLPGIFVAAAGPPFFQILQTLDGFLAPYRGLGP